MILTNPLKKMLCKKPVMYSKQRCMKHTITFTYFLLIYLLKWINKLDGYVKNITFFLSLIEPLPLTIILHPVSCSNCFAVIPLGPRILPTKLNCNKRKIYDICKKIEHTFLLLYTRKRNAYWTWNKNLEYIQMIGTSRDKIKIFIRKFCHVMISVRIKYANTGLITNIIHK